MRNNKGLSEIVATLIIILLTLVAVGIIWVVIRGVVSSGTQQIDISSKCTAISLSAVSSTEVQPGNYSVTLKRAAGGDAIAGIRVSILNASQASSGPMDFGIALNSLDTKTATFITGTNTITNGAASTRVVNGHTLEFTPYFKDASGNEQDCSQTQTFSF